MPCPCWASEGYSPVWGGGGLAGQCFWEACLGGPTWLSLGRIAGVLSVPPLMAKQGLAAVGHGGRAPSRFWPSPQVVLGGTVQRLCSPASHRVVGLVLWASPLCEVPPGQASTRLGTPSPPLLTFWFSAQPECVSVPRAQSVTP